MTLAAKERFGETFFTRSSQAYFIDNLQEQAKGRRTIPDWWRELRTQEERRRRQAHRTGPATNDRSEQELRKYSETEVREAFERIMDQVFRSFKTAGQPDQTASEKAKYLAEMHFRTRFFQEHPEWRGDGPVRLTDAISS